MTAEHQSGPETVAYDENTIHLAILEALADGVHPLTGDALPEDNVLRSPEVRAAFAAGMAALRKEAERQARSAELPKKAGQPWSTAEDERLAAGFDAGKTMKELAEEHGRTPGAIQSRLAKLGKLMP